MINKKNRRNLNKNKIRQNREKNNFFSEKRFKKKKWNEIKVVSTNILKNKNKEKDTKDNKEKKDKKPNYHSVKETNYKKVSENKNEKDFKFLNSNKNDIEKKAVLKNHFVQYKLNRIGKKVCSKCNKKIEEMKSSIKDNKTDQYYHFNCVINEIKKDNAVDSKQRIVYLGNGAFGIIEDLEPETNNHKFIIKKKIQYIDNSL